MVPVIGRVDIILSGKRRALACDMRAVALLYDAVGEDWSEWLSTRFYGVLMPEADGIQARVAAQIPAEDLGLALHCLLASDRERSRIEETPERILASLDGEGRKRAQELAMDSIGPSFGLPGKGLKVGRTRRSKAKWDWRTILETGLGLLGLAPDVFWSMTLAEWRAASNGRAARRYQDRQQKAWILSNLLVAAGCDSAKVTPRKLMGERVRVPMSERSDEERKASAERVAAAMVAKAKGQANG